MSPFRRLTRSRRYRFTRAIGASLCGVVAVVAMMSAVVLVAMMSAGGMTASGMTASAAGTAVPSYDHVFLIMEENNSYGNVVGNPAAPNLNSYVDQFGTANRYYGLNGPSEPNYVGLLGDNTFGTQQ